MTNPLHIPKPGSPLDIARAIAYDPNVQQDIRNLLASIRMMARLHGVSGSDTMTAIDLHGLDPTLGDAIALMIEQRFETALDKCSRGKTLD